ncbi:hypothetical protein AB0N73_09120 [Microbacterium sp. NPDC089189]
MLQYLLWDSPDIEMTPAIDLTLVTDAAQPMRQERPQLLGLKRVDCG